VTRDRSASYNQGNHSAQSRTWDFTENKNRARKIYFPNAQSNGLFVIALFATTSYLLVQSVDPIPEQISSPSICESLSPAARSGCVYVHKFQEWCPTRGWRCSRRRDGSAFAGRHPDQLLDFSDGAMLISAPVRCRESCRCRLSARRRPRSSEFCRRTHRRFRPDQEAVAQTRGLRPMLRKRDVRSHSRRNRGAASSNTMKGALPPSSSESFFRWRAHCRINC